MKKAQIALSEKNLLKPLDPAKIELVVALDAAYSRKYGGVGVAVVFSYPKLVQIDYGVSVGEPAIPYIPGLLAFREAPLFYTATLNIIERIGCKNCMLLVDGHGISHPRRAGIATHIGLALKLPSIGVAKRRLYGKEVRNGERLFIIDEKGEKIAIVYERGRRKLYVSPGAFIALNSVSKIMQPLLKKNMFLPFPLHAADRISKRIARDLDRNVLKPNALKAMKRLEGYL